MDVIAADGDRFVFNLVRGEELMATLMGWCKEKEIAGATLTGLGAADQMELAYYNLETKSYERHQLEEEVEILSLTGNLAEFNLVKDKLSHGAGGEKILHIHGVFGRRDLSTFGGHVMNLRVSGACEIHLTTFATPFKRQFNEETGLNLLSGET